MNILLPALVAVTISAVAGRYFYRRWRRRRITETRRIEAPNSHYSSAGVRSQEDRERWGDIVMPNLHPLNQEEVVRLLEVVDTDGAKTLSSKDRLFLDNMTIPRLAM